MRLIKQSAMRYGVGPLEYAVAMRHEMMLEALLSVSHPPAPPLPFPSPVLPYTSLPLPFCPLSPLRANSLLSSPPTPFLSPSLPSRALPPPRLSSFLLPPLSPRPSTSLLIPTPPSRPASSLHSPLTTSFLRRHHPSATFPRHLPPLSHTTTRPHLSPSHASPPPLIYSSPSPPLLPPRQKAAAILSSAIQSSTSRPPPPSVRRLSWARRRFSPSCSWQARTSTRGRREWICRGMTDAPR